MAKSVSGIQELLTKLKKNAGPWNKDTHEIIEKITAALGKLMPMSMPPESVTSQVVQLLRHLMSKLYDPFTTASLQLAVATFGFIIHEKMVHAVKAKLLKERMQWEAIAEAVLDGVLDYLDVVDQKDEAGSSTKAKEAVSQAFYSTICTIFFSADFSVPSQSFSVKLRVLAYSIIFSTCDGIPKNIEKLRSPKVLGSERLGRVIAKTKDYVALEQLLDLLARLIPPTNNTAKGRASRKLFIEEVFIKGGGDAIPGDDIVKLLEFINSSEWEETSAKIVDILARDMSFPQPFKVKAIEIYDITFKLRASDRFYVDSNSFLINNWNEYEEEEAIKIQYSSLRQVKVNDTGAVQIMASSPATVGDREMARPTDDQSVLINFIIGQSDVERFTSAIGARGLGRLVQQNGHLIKNSTARISTIPGQLALSEGDKTLSQPLSFVEKVKVVKIRGEISERSDDNATFPNPLDGGTHDESPLPHASATTADSSGISRAAAPAGRARGKINEPSRDSDPDPAVSCGGLPDVPAPRTGHAPELTQHTPTALPPVRARPAPRPTGRATRAAAPDPVRAAPDGLPTSPAGDAPDARTRSQKNHDAVFGTDDEELSDVSDRKLEDCPRSALAGVTRPGSHTAVATTASSPVAVRAGDSKDHASHPRGDAATAEGGAAKPKLDGAAILRGRRVVTQEPVQGHEEIVVLGASEGTKDRKKRAAEESAEEDVVELDSKAKGKAKAKAKAKAKKPPKKQSKVDAGEAGGKSKKAAAKVRPKAKPKTSVVAQGDSTSNGGPGETVVDNRSPRSRPTRSSAVTASKRIARQASEESIPLDHGDIEQLEENVKARPPRGAPQANSIKDDSRSSEVHAPEAVSEDARASTPVQIAPIVQPVPTTPAFKRQGMKRKRGLDADTGIPAASSPYPESKEPQAKRKRPLPEVIPKAPTPPRPRKLNSTRENARPTKKYGKAAKDKSSSPALSVVDNVDYDEIPSETGNFARASSPVANVNSSPAKIVASTGKSKVARMKAKDGSTPVAPEKGKGVPVKDIATSATVVKKEPKSVACRAQEAEDDDAIVLEISPSPVPSRKAAASKKAAIHNTVEDSGDQNLKTKNAKKEPVSKFWKKSARDVAQETTATKSQMKLNEHWSSRKSNKAPWLEEQYAVKTEVEHKNEVPSSDDARELTDEIQNSSQSALPPPPSDITFTPNFDDFDITRDLEAVKDRSTREKKGSTKAEEAFPLAAETAAEKAKKKEAMTIDLTAYSPPPKSKPKPKPKSRAKPFAPPSREPSEQHMEPSLDVNRSHRAPPNDAEEADDPFVEMDDVYRDAYQDFTAPLNSSGRLFSPTDTSKATTSSDPVQAPHPPLPQITPSAKKNVTFAAGVQEAEERKMAKEKMAIADDSCVFWTNKSKEEHSADSNTGIKRLEERRVERDKEFDDPQAARAQLQMNPSPASPKVTRSSKSKKIAVEFEQDRPQTKGTPIASEDPVAEITSILDAISNVVKSKITEGFDGVSRSAREARRRILNQAMHELDEIGQTNAPTFNGLVKLEEAYGAYSHQSIAASNTAIESLQQTSDHLQKVIQEHDRAVQAHSKAMPKLKPFPKVTRWL